MSLLLLFSNPSNAVAAGLDLFLAGHDAASSGCTLHVASDAAPWLSGPLFVSGPGTGSEGMVLSVRGGQDARADATLNLANAARALAAELFVAGDGTEDGDVPASGRMVLVLAVTPGTLAAGTLYAAGGISGSADAPAFVACRDGTAAGAPLSLAASAAAGSAAGLYAGGF